MRALLTGAAGWFAGHFLDEALRQRWPVSASYGEHRRAGYPADQQFFLDLSRPDTFGALDDLRPQVIIHAAAISKPLACERDRRLAWRINVEGTANLIEHAARWGGRVILLSTDQVFDGTADEYTEESTPCPVNFYGFTKAEAEKLVLQAGGTVVRLSLMFGPGLPLWEDLIAALRAGRSMQLFSDLVRAPTWVGDVIRAVKALAFESQPTEGIWHVVNPQSADRHAWGLNVAEVMGCDPALLKPVPYPTSTELHVPLRLKLHSRRLEEDLHLRCHNLRDGVKIALASPGA